ncbi:hypothetical protein TWF788_002224 [Orbilia oligospora]|uniref:Bromodomain associated domain-containing protein n=1 Tax=Orbilia oligospora TaxID=2813651 RepID=A0A7C8TZ12_ORBOL|nr:hypothetical protein TWF788_002224 [Orbilia oligospora]
MDSQEQFYFSLLRISTAQMLRHAGLAGSRPSVLDSLTDMTARYLTLLGTTARSISESSNREESDVPDVLCAMEHVGLLRPLTLYNADLDDTRAIDNFITWAKSPEIEELRKIAGVVTVEVDDKKERDEDVNAVVPDTTTTEAGTGGSAVDATGAGVNGTTGATGSVAMKTVKTTTGTKRPAEKSKEVETDIPIKREVVDDQPTPLMMDIDSVPLDDNMAAGTPGPLGGAGSGARDTEPPGDGIEEEGGKGRVKLKQVDWFTSLKIKEDASRFKGTVLGKHIEKNIVVEGGDSKVRKDKLVKGGLGEGGPNNDKLGEDEMEKGMLGKSEATEKKLQKRKSEGKNPEEIAPQKRRRTSLRLREKRGEGEEPETDEQEPKQDEEDSPQVKKSEHQEDDISHPEGGQQETAQRREESRFGGKDSDNCLGESGDKNKTKRGRSGEWGYGFGIRRRYSGD